MADPLAESINIELELNDTVFSVGDKVFITYKINYEKKLLLILPDLSNLFTNIELLNYHFDTTISTLNLTLIAFDTTTLLLPQITFLFEDTINNRFYTKIAPTKELTINNFNINSNALKDIPYQELTEYTYL